MWRLVLAVALLASSGDGQSGQSAPALPPRNMAFTDRDLQRNEIGGYLVFQKATSEVGILTYELYFGSSATTRLAPLGSVPVTGFDISFFIPDDTVIPSLAGRKASYLLAFSKNGVWGEGAGTSCPLYDAAVPVNLPTGILFTDTDDNWGEVAGLITVQRAPDESDVTDYFVYWGLGPTTMASYIFAAPKTVGVVRFNLRATKIPAGVTHILAYSANVDGLSITPFALPLVDYNIPHYNATSLVFVLDIDMDKGQITGSVLIGRAVSELGVSNYAIYFGYGALGPKGPYIMSVSPVGSDPFYVSGLIPPDTAVPNGATYLMVFTQSNFGEMSTGISTTFVDRFVPVVKPVGLSFFDTDIDFGELSGTIYVQRAVPETDVTRYKVSFANFNLDIISDIVVWAASPPVDLNYTFWPLPKIPPSGATNLIAFTGSVYGWMATGFVIPLVDRAVPTVVVAMVSFVDTNYLAGHLGGYTSASRVSDEAAQRVTNYSCYFGTTSSAVTANIISKVGTNATSSLSSSSTMVQFSMDNFIIPTGANYIYVFTGNAVGDARTGASVAIVDRTGVNPLQSVPTMTFRDLDLGYQVLGGPITWLPPSDVIGLTHYNLYLALDDMGALRQLLVGAVPITTYTWTMPSSTRYGANKFFIINVANTYGEGPGFALAILDLALPIDLVTGMRFDDVDPLRGFVAGALIWTPPVNPPIGTPTRLTDFSVSTATAPSNGSFASSTLRYIGQVAVGTNSIQIPFGTAIGTGSFTYFLVLSRNANGNSRQGSSLAINDKFLPTLVVSTLKFFDEDLMTAALGGFLVWAEPIFAVAGGVEYYAVYFADDAGSEQRLGQVPVGKSLFAVPFHTYLRNWTKFVVVTGNTAGESIYNASIDIVDQTTLSCPPKTSHGFLSSRWRVVAGPTAAEWRLTAVVFYEDSYCTRQIPTVPQGWPRGLAQDGGSPFAQPFSKRHLHDIFLPYPRFARYTIWDNGTQSPTTPTPWSSGSPCVEADNETYGDIGLRGQSGCYAGFDWESALLPGTNLLGARVLHKKWGVQCVLIQQDEIDGHYASTLVVQFYDDVTGEFRSLLRKEGVQGGQTQIIYQATVAASCTR